MCEILWNILESQVCLVFNISKYTIVYKYNYKLKLIVGTFYRPTDTLTQTIYDFEVVILNVVHKLRI